MSGEENPARRILVAGPERFVAYRETLKMRVD
jgi:hypothetical protein